MENKFDGDARVRAALSACIVRFSINKVTRGKG
jgi:hypothetical protein